VTLHAASTLQPDCELLLQAAVAASQPSTGKTSSLKSDGTGITFSSRLLGEGYHRKVEYSWSCKTAADLSSAEPSSIGIVQPLPAGLFADMNELGNMAKMSSSRAAAVTWTAALLGSADVEATIVESKTAVLVLQANSSGSNSIADGAAVLRVPLHARYAMPTHAPPALNRLRWAQSPLTTTAMPPATLLIFSGDDGSWRDVAKHNDVSWWDVPAASAPHAKLVALGTSTAVVLSCAVVLMEARRLQAGG